MNSHQKLAARVIEAASIETIHLVTVSARHCRLPGVDEKLLLHVARQARPSDRVSDDGSFSVRAEFKVTVSSSAEDPLPPFQMECAFLLTYRLPEDLKPDLGELKAFAQTNAMFNAWPYLRENVQSMAGRMGLPTTTLPLWRMPRSRHAKSNSRRKKGESTVSDGRVEGASLPARGRGTDHV